MPAPSQVLARIQTFSSAVPLLVLMPVLALVIQTSPFYIDLAATACVGALFCWRLHAPGFLTACTLLISVLFYDAYVTHDDFNLTQAFIIIISQTLLFGATWAASIFQENLTTINNQEEQTVSVTADVELQQALQRVTIDCKRYAETAERYQRLLSMAREELLLYHHQRDHLEQSLLGQRLLTAKHDERLELLTEECHQLHAQLMEKNHTLASAQERIQELLGAMEGLTERLRRLDAEKEQLKKGMDSALDPKRLK